MTSSFLECWGRGLTGKNTLLFSLTPYVFIHFLPMYFQELLASPSFTLKLRAACSLIMSPQYLTISIN